MKDFLGNTIEIGDVGVCLVADSTSSWLKMCRVVRFTPKFIYVSDINDSDFAERKAPDRFVKLRPEDMTMALLQK